ncbi:MAG: glycosyltransferase family 2 protein, partial [Bacteroidetes bacterium]|nr:glycosyltransferase family 2 protein [Bacteroidota bacterium]
QQSLGSFELICINDGSGDSTGEEILRFRDPRIRYINKANTGVSDTRNVGFSLSNGKYILYLDADDILSEHFLQKRVDYLEQHPEMGFCCSEVIKIDEAGTIITDTKWVGAHSNILLEVLSYNLKIITCPSNYLFRKELLQQHSIKFDPGLSSSADRFFLIELSNVAKCGLVKDAYLYYRMHPSSMSHKLTLNLLRDNFVFKQKILSLDYIPAELKKEFCFKTNYILAGSYYKLKKAGPFLLYSLKAFYYNPAGFLKQLTK